MPTQQQIIASNTANIRNKTTTASITPTILASTMDLIAQGIGEAQTAAGNAALDVAGALSLAGDASDTAQAAATAAAAANTNANQAKTLAEDAANTAGAAIDSLSTKATAATVADVSNILTVKLFGDSLTFGSGSISTAQYPGGVPYGDFFSRLAGINVDLQAVPGQTSAQIRTRVLAQSATDKAKSHIFWAGTNNLGNSAAIKQDIADMVASLGHNRYLVIGLVGQRDPSYHNGQPANISIKQLNTDLGATYGPRFVDFRSVIVTGDPNNVPPAAVMADETHGNTNFYQILAQTLVPKTIYLYPTDNKALTLAALDAIFSAIKNVQAQTLAVGGADTLNRFYNNGNGGVSEFKTVSKGGVKITHTAADHGFVIRDMYINEGGFSNVELAGTNPEHWPAAAGMRFHNGLRRIDFGSAVRLSDRADVLGSMTIGGEIAVTGQITTSAAGSIANKTNPRGALDISGASGKGLIHVQTSQAGLDNWRGGSPYGGGLPDVSETVYNESNGKFYYGVRRSDNPGYTRFVYLINSDEFATNIGTLQEQINVLTQGAVSAKLTGGIAFGTPTYAAGYEAGKAFDGDNANESRYATFGANAWELGLNFTAPKVLTKIVIRTYGNPDLNGAKIQGSNQDVEGWVDLFTIPASFPSFQDVEFSITGSDDYKRFRLTQAASGNYSIDIVELSFYGHDKVYSSNELKTLLDNLAQDVADLGGGSVGGAIETWTTATRPGSPIIGESIGYNTDLNLYEFWNGSAWVVFAYPKSWDNATRPATPPAGLAGLNTQTGAYEMYDSTAGAWATLERAYNWNTVGRPTDPDPGMKGYNSTDNVYEYWNGTTWIQY